MCDGVCRRGRAKHPTSKQSSRNTRGGNLVDPFQQRTSSLADGGVCDGDEEGREELKQDNVCVTSQTGKKESQLAPNSSKTKPGKVTSCQTG